MLEKKRKYQIRLFWLPVLACLSWVILTFALYRHSLTMAEDYRLELERIRLSTVAHQILDARNWNASHGGIYVMMSEFGKPNPWLPENERTLEAKDGRNLVLMNPAYMTRQLAERNTWPGMHISIVSKNPLRPENKADDWEVDALNKCDNGEIEVFTNNIDNNQKLRLLTVLRAQEDCLRCHVTKKVGDVLGGISVAGDNSSYLEDISTQSGNMFLLYTLLGITGVLAIGGLTLNLNMRRWQAEETGRMQSAFVARLSHDMRTPLTAILGMSDLLQNKNKSPKEQAHALHYLTRAANALLEMVRDITDHAQLSQGDLVINDQWFNIENEIEHCLELYRPAANAKKILLKSDTSNLEVKEVCGDAFRLRQILGNLVSNAVKFTDEGSVEVQATCKKIHKTRVLLQIKVLDTGPGIAEEECEHIFESFRRGSRTGDQPGTGLGLNIARTIARRMNGDIKVCSRESGGSCFTLDVKLKAADLLNKKVDEGKSDKSNYSGVALQNLKILVAEDNPASRYYLEQALVREGANVTVSFDGISTLKSIEERKEWDLIILDARMPNPDGLEVLRRIRNGETKLSPKQKVAIYTAALDKNTEEQFRILNPDALMIKPMSFGLLRDQILIICKSNNLPLWDKEKALESVDYDEEVLEHLIEVLQNDLNDRLNQLNEAINNDNTNKIREIAHACKNSAGTMAFLRLQEEAKIVEKCDILQVNEHAKNMLNILRSTIELINKRDD